MCSSRVYTKKGSEKKEGGASVETKQKRRGCVRPFLVIFAVYWLESCVLVPLFLVRLVLADRIFQRLPTARTCPVPIQDWFIDRHSMLDFWATPKEKWTTEGKREREREKEGIPVLSAFGHFRWLTFSPEPINVFTQSSYGFWIFFFSINDSFLIIDNSSSRSVKKISI